MKKIVSDNDKYIEYKYIKRTGFWLFLYFILIASFYTLLTTHIFQVRVNGFLWWIFLFYLFYLGFRTIQLWRRVPGNLRIKVNLTILYFLLLGVSVLMAVRFKSFSLKNINFGSIIFFPWGISHLDTNNYPAPKDEVTYEKYLPPVINQGGCSSCWAVASATMLSARLNIEEGLIRDSSILGKKNCINDDDRLWHFSPQAIIDFDKISSLTKTGKCNSSFYYQGLKIAEKGIPPMSCVPNFSSCEPNCRKDCDSPETEYYRSDIQKIVKGCLLPGQGSNKWTSCTSGESMTLHKAKNIRTLSGEEEMKKEISKNGPIQCLINIYKKRNGEYAGWTLSDNSIVSAGYVVRPTNDKNEYTKSFNMGAHSIVVYGYGVSGDIPYWDVRNSWGEAWGYRGNIKIERGIDAWNIEKHCLTAEVDTDS